MYVPRNTWYSSILAWSGFGFLWTSYLDSVSIYLTACKASLTLSIVFPGFPMGLVLLLCLTRFVVFTSSIIIGKIFPKPWLHMSSPAFVWFLFPLKFCYIWLAILKQGWRVLHSTQRDRILLSFSWITRCLTIIYPKCLLFCLWMRTKTVLPRWWLPRAAQ